MRERLLLLGLALSLSAGCHRGQAPIVRYPAEILPAAGEGEPGSRPAELAPADDGLVRSTLDLPLGEVDSAAFAQAYHLDALDLGAHDVPVVLNDDVIKWMAYYTGRAHGTFALWIARSGQFRPMIETTLHSEGLPRELFYVAMIESGYSPTAVSRAQACGLWQFMGPTGRQMGLCVDRYLDERFDPDASTRAAARYLRYLYSRFGDWPLTLAAYNGGEGRVGSAITRTGVSDYWELCRRGELPRETCAYVPRFLSALILTEHQDLFGFDVTAEPPWMYDVVEVPGGVSLEVVATCTGSDCQIVEDLNPQLRRPYTPPGAEAVRVRVPLGSAEAFASRFAEIPREELAGAVHVIASGENPGSIARRYGISVEELMRANGIRDPRRLQVGQELTIPGMVTVVRTAPPPAPASAPAAGFIPTGPAAPAEAPAVVASAQVKEASAPAEGPVPTGPAAPAEAPVTVAMAQGKQTPAPVPAASAETKDAPITAALVEVKEAPARSPSGPTLKHTVRSGESLWTISQRYGVSVADLKAWNHLRGDALRAGQSLTVQAADTEPGPSHTVARGDTLGHIAARYDVRVADLKKWNGLASDRLREGQVLRVGASSGIPAQRYVVKDGDSLWSIASARGVGVEELKRWNGLASETLRPGQELLVYGGEATASVSYHTVQAGESLWTVSRRYGLEVAKLRRWNALDGDTVHPGDRLRLGP